MEEEASLVIVGHLLVHYGYEGRVEGRTRRQNEAEKLRRVSVGGRLPPVRLANSDRHRRSNGSCRTSPLDRFRAGVHGVAIVLGRADDVLL
jgi:hypothetical protein